MKSNWLVLYLSRTPVYPGFLSGGELHFLQIFKHAFKDNNLEFIAPPTGKNILREYNFTEKIRQLSVPFEKALDRWSNLGISLVYFLRTIRSIPLALSLPRQYTLIIATAHFLPDVLPAVLIGKRNPKAKIVIYLHHIEPVPWKAKGRAIHGSLLSWVNTVFSLWLIKRFAHAVITVNPEVKKELVNRGIQESKIHIFPNGIDMEKIQSTEGAGEQYEACYFGRLAPTKGVSDIVEIWNDVRKKHPLARVAIMGGNGKGYVSQLKQQIQDGSLEQSIHILGVIPEEKKYSSIKACGFSICPSYEEGWGIALCETMACGLPVVAYDLPAYRVFGDEAIFKVPVGDKRALSDAVLKLLSDEKLRTKISQKAKEVANCFSWTEIAKAELQLFHSLEQEENEKK